MLSVFLFSCPSEVEDEFDPYYVNPNEKIASYLGMLLGSSGYYLLELIPSQSKMTMVFDGKEHQLVSNRAFVPEDKFEDFYFSDGTIRVDVSFASNFNSPDFHFSIPGHQIEYSIHELKEESNFSIYLGTLVSSNFTVFKDETYNLILDHSTKGFQILNKITDSSETEDIGKIITSSGTFVIEGNKITLKLLGSGDLEFDYSTEKISINRSGANNFKFQLNLERAY